MPRKIKHVVEGSSQPPVETPTPEPETPIEPAPETPEKPVEPAPELPNLGIVIITY